MSEAASVLHAYAGLSQTDATALAKSVADAAADEALDIMAGQVVAASSVADQRALRLKYICGRAKRILPRREIELIFRVQASTALSTLRRMQALYPVDVEPWLATVVQSAEVYQVGGAGSAGRYEFIFTEQSALDQARRILERRGTSGEVQARPASLTLEVPIRMTDRAGKEYDPKAELGVRAKPKRRP